MQFGWGRNNIVVLDKSYHSRNPDSNVNLVILWLCKINCAVFTVKWMFLYNLLSEATICHRHLNIFYWILQRTCNPISFNIGECWLPASLYESEVIFYFAQHNLSIGIWPKRTSCWSKYPVSEIAELCFRKTGCRVRPPTFPPSPTYNVSDFYHHTLLYLPLRRQVSSTPPWRRRWIYLDNFQIYI